MGKKSNQVNGWRREVQNFYDDIIKNFELEADSLKVFQVACHSLDRYLESKEKLDSEGITYMTSTGILKKNPAFEVEKVSKAQFLQAMRMLGISDVEPNRPGRPTTRAGL
jgi:P27 family predicted phage terminase small subunit